MFIPITFDTNTQALQELFKGLKPAPRLTTKWIKPLNRRTNGQQSRSMILMLQTPEAANTAIRKWMFIEGKQVKVSKLIAEPRCCMKCQQVDASHIAAGCTSKHNVCGTSSKEHKMMYCAKKDRNTMKCTNCKVMGHPAWDYVCPFFTQKTDTYNKKHPKNLYRFYPTADPSTWELLDNEGSSKNRSSPNTTKPSQIQIPMGFV